MQHSHPTPHTHRSANATIVAASQVPRPHNAKSVLDCLLFVLKEGAGELPAAVETDEDLVRLTYMSKETSSMSASDVQAIHQVAHVFNGSVGITGFLMYQAPWFFQTLEGPRENVDRLLAKISADSRHRDVRVLEKKQSVRTRLYPWWTMEVIDVGTGAKLSKNMEELVKQATTFTRAPKPIGSIKERYTHASRKTENEREREKASKKHRIRNTHTPQRPVWHLGWPGWARGQSGRRRLVILLRLCVFLWCCLGGLFGCAHVFLFVDIMGVSSAAPRPLPRCVSVRFA